MDRQSTIIVLVCLVLIALWSFLLVPKMYPPKPLPPGATNTFGGTLTATNLPSATSSTTPTAIETATTPLPVANPSAPEDLIEVTNANAKYTFTSHGGGLKLVELLQYPESVLSRRERSRQSQRVATLNASSPV